MLINKFLEIKIKDTTKGENELKHILETKFFNTFEESYENDTDFEHYFINSSDIFEYLIKKFREYKDIQEEGLQFTLENTTSLELLKNYMKDSPELGKSVNEKIKQLKKGKLEGENEDELELYFKHILTDPEKQDLLLIL